MKYLITLLLVGQVCLLNAQSDILFWESSASFDYTASDRITLNSGIGQRSLFLEKEENGDSYEQLFYDIDQFATAKVNSSIKISAGYKYRFKRPFDAASLYEHRLTQQLAFSHLKSAVRIVSRVRTEQRFRNNSDFIHRYRYRLSADFPLSGASLDVREFYIVASSEFLLSAQKNVENELDSRLNASLGYVASKIIKLQISLTQRFENFNNATDKRTFLATDIFFNLN